MNILMNMFVPELCEVVGLFSGYFKAFFLRMIGRMTGRDVERTVCYGV